MTLSYLDIEKILMNELRLYHHPVATTFLFTDEDVLNFTRQTPHYTPAKPMSFCQWALSARMQSKTVLGTQKDLDCAGASAVLGWRDLTDPGHARTLSKYCVDAEQIERFVMAKPHLERDALKAVAVGPLGQAKVKPHVVHVSCDTMQAYHLSVDYMAATDTPILRPALTGSAASCGGTVFCWNEHTFNFCPGCAGTYSSGKLERGEVNVFIPGDQIESVVRRLLKRKEESGTSAIARPGEPFPGSDVCKNCPQIVFKKVLCDSEPA